MLLYFSSHVQKDMRDHLESNTLKIVWWKNSKYHQKRTLLSIEIIFVFAVYYKFDECQSGIIGSRNKMASKMAASLSLSHWYPGSGAVLDCIDS